MSAQFAPAQAESGMQTQEQPNRSQQIVIADHHGHPVDGDLWQTKPTYRKFKEHRIVIELHRIRSCGKALPSP